MLSNRRASAARAPGARAPRPSWRRHAVIVRRAAAGAAEEDVRRARRRSGRRPGPGRAAGHGGQRVAVAVGWARPPGRTPAPRDRGAGRPADWPAESSIWARPAQLLTHGQPVARPQAGHDDRRAPQHPPARAGPRAWRIGRGTSSSGRRCPGRRRPGTCAVAVLPCWVMLRICSTRSAASSCAVGAGQCAGDHVRACPWSGRGRLVLAVLPGQQERLHRRLGGGPAALDEAEAMMTPTITTPAAILPTVARGSRCHLASPGLPVPVPGSPWPGISRAGGLGRGGAGPRSAVSGGVRAAVTRARHHPPLRYLRRRKARSTSLAASLSARSWRLS